MRPPLFQDGPAIERLTSIDVGRFKERYVEPQRPVIFGSGFADWRALHTWTPAYLQDRFPGLPVVDEHTRESVRLDVFAAQIERSAPRWGRVFLIDQYADMLPDVSPLPVHMGDNWLNGHWLPKWYGLKARVSHPARPDLLIGGPSSYFPMYHHEHNFCHCLLFQVYGYKQVVLFAPAAKDALYPEVDHPNKSTLSPVEVPDPAAYPLFSGARFCTGTLSPGDTLFSPSGWWLGLRNPVVSLTVRRHYVERGNWRPFCRELIARRRSRTNRVKAALDAAVLQWLGAACVIRSRRDSPAADS
jgi:hypothetical protein